MLHIDNATFLSVFLVTHQKFHLHRKVQMTALWRSVSTGGVSSDQSVSSEEKPLPIFLRPAQTTVALSVHTVDLPISGRPSVVHPDKALTASWSPATAATCPRYRAPPGPLTPDVHGGWLSENLLATIHLPVDFGDAQQHSVRWSRLAAPTAFAHLAYPPPPPRLPHSQLPTSIKTIPLLCVLRCKVSTKSVTFVF